MSKLGRFVNNVNVPNAYLAMSVSDERAAKVLFEHREYRQACYFLIQAMEKRIRSKIFTLVNPNHEYFRDRNRTHSLDDAVTFLIDICSTNDIVKKQITLQLQTYVLGNIKYNFVHNNLRYPHYSNKYNAYSMLEVNEKDFNLLCEKFDLLKKFLENMHHIH